MNQTEHSSHRGGQGFKSSQLHTEPQVSGSSGLPADAFKIVCHPDVTGINR